MGLLSAIVVAELPALSSGSKTPDPRFVLVLPQGSTSRLPKNVLAFCFPDLDELAKRPFAYDHAAEEYTFTLTPKDDARLHGFCRRYRIAAPEAGGRLDVAPAVSSSSSDTVPSSTHAGPPVATPGAATAAATASDTPAYQCICILSERPYMRFFSQCLQLLHASRMASGAVALRLARSLLEYTGAPQGAILPLRSLCSVPAVPGILHLPRERLRVPPAIGLPLSDIPLSALLSRLDAPALLLLYVALLSERRVMFVAANLGTLTTCVHAAAALLQPFEWQHIFIPTLPAAYLPYCCAPSPYLIGLTPAQFATLNEEYDVGEIVLVALDEGYVAVLNGGAPLPELDPSGAPPSSSASGGGQGGHGGSGHYTPGGGGAGGSGGGSSGGSAASAHTPGGSSSGGGGGGLPGDFGYAVYSGPKPPPEKSLQRMLSSLSTSAGGSSSGGFASYLAADAVTETPTDGIWAHASDSGGGGGGGGGSGYELSPWYAFHRSHAFDDDAVLGRAVRRAYMLRRWAARQVLRDQIAAFFIKEPSHAAVRAGARAAAARAAATAAAAASAAGGGLLDLADITGVHGSSSGGASSDPLFSFGESDEDGGADSGGSDQGKGADAWGFSSDVVDFGGGAGAGGIRVRADTSLSSGGGGWGTADDIAVAGALADLLPPGASSEATIGRASRVRPRNPAVFLSPTGAVEAAKASRRAASRLTAGEQQIAAAGGAGTHTQGSSGGGGGGGGGHHGRSASAQFLAGLQQPLDPSQQHPHQQQRGPSTASASAASSSSSARPTSLPPRDHIASSLSQLSIATSTGPEHSSGGAPHPPSSPSSYASSVLEYGVACSLPVDLLSMSTRFNGPGASAMRRRSSVARRGSAVGGDAAAAANAAASSSASASSGGGAGGNLLRRAAMQTMARAGKALMAGIAGAAGGGGPSSDCPGARLAHEVRTAYARERKEGVFDEAAVYAATLAFVVCVFGRITDFVHVEGSADLQQQQQHAHSPTPGGQGTPLPVPGSPGRGTSSPGAGAALEPKFAKEEFIRLTVRHASIARLLEEVQHSQLLQSFAAESYVKQLARRPADHSSGGGGGGGRSPGPAAFASSAHTTSTPPPAQVHGGGAGSGSGGRVNIMDIALTEAFGPAYLSGGGGFGSVGSYGGGGGGSIGSYGGGGGSSGHYGGSYGSSTGGPAGLLGAAANYSSVHKRVYTVLSLSMESLADAGSNAFGSDRGVAGSPHTVPSALAALHAAAASVTAISAGRLSNLPSGLGEAPPPVVVTALRGLLVAATSAGQQPDESLASVARVASAATHDSSLCSVVMGVVWARLNDCSVGGSGGGDKSWQHGYRALTLLSALLRTGSPRVWSLSMSFLPLLRFLLAPHRTLAARASAVAEDMGGQVTTCGLVAGAGAVSRGTRRGMFGAAPAPIAGLALSAYANPLNSVSAREGAALLVREAARVYLLVSNPKRWMLERALAAGPSVLMTGAPITLPFPLPCVPASASSVPAVSGLPPGWLPSLAQPAFLPLPPLPQPGGGGASSLPPLILALPCAWVGPPADDGRALALQGTLSSGGGGGLMTLVPLSGPLAVSRQPRAVEAPWDQVHRVAAPAVCSSSSAALAALAAKYGISASAMVARPPRRAVASAGAGAGVLSAPPQTAAAGASAARAGPQSGPGGAVTAQQQQQPPTGGLMRSMQEAMSAPRKQWGAPPLSSNTASSSFSSSSGGSGGGAAGKGWSAGAGVGTAAAPAPAAATAAIAGAFDFNNFVNQQQQDGGAASSSSGATASSASASGASSSIGRGGPSQPQQQQQASTRAPARPSATAASAPAGGATMLNGPRLNGGGGGSTNMGAVAASSAELLTLSRPSTTLSSSAQLHDDLSSFLMGTTPVSALSTAVAALSTSAARPPPPSSVFDSWSTSSPSSASASAAAAAPPPVPARDPFFSGATTATAAATNGAPSIMVHFPTPASSFHLSAAPIDRNDGISSSSSRRPRGNSGRPALSDIFNFAQPPPDAAAAGTAGATSGSGSGGRGSAPVAATSTSAPSGASQQQQQPASSVFDVFSVDAPVAAHDGFGNAADFGFDKPAAAAAKSVEARPGGGAADPFAF